MASHFNMGILPVITFEEPKLVFGIPDGKDIGEIDAYNYSISKNIAQFMKSSQNTNPILMSWMPSSLKSILITIIRLGIR
jgi:hypothetical protein